jgi:hypothetical protein
MEGLTTTEKADRRSVMGIIVRSMIQSDFIAISTAYRQQQTDVSPTVFAKYFEFIRGGEYDVLVAELTPYIAGFTRIAWYGTSESEIIQPEILEFVVFDRYAGYGVAQALASETQRRIMERTGDMEENVLLAIYSGQPRRMQHSNYVLDGLFVNREGKFEKPQKDAKTEARKVLCITGRPANPASLP